jgi:hypothetical protein
MSTSQNRTVIVRLPADVVRWLDQRASYNLSSRNSEVVRILRTAVGQSRGCSDTAEVEPRSLNDHQE